MNILFLNKFFYVKGGAERVFFEEMSVLQKSGHSCIPFSRKSPRDLSSPYSSYFAPPLVLGNILSPAALRSAAGIIYSREVKRYLGRLLDRVRPDIAHGHNIYGHLTSSVLDIMHDRGIPAVISLHDYKILCPNYQFLHENRICEDCKPHRYYEAVRKRCVHGNLIYSSIYAIENYFNNLFSKYRRKVTKFVAVSRFIRDKFIEYGYPPDQIVFIPNFIDVAGYEASYGHKKYFLYLGRLSGEKGISTLLKAFEKLDRTDYRLVIVGDGPLKDELQAQARLFAPDRIQFTGFLSGAALADAVKNSSCVVVPSEWYENCPMSVLEALAYGKPVIGAKIGGIPELIEDRTDGWIFESGNVEDLARKMDAVACSTPDHLEAMGRAARKKIETVYNAQRHCESLVSLYQSILT